MTPDTLRAIADELERLVRDDSMTVFSGTRTVKCRTILARTRKLREQAAKLDKELSPEMRKRGYE